MTERIVFSMVGYSDVTLFKTESGHSILLHVNVQGSDVAIIVNAVCSPKIVNQPVSKTGS